MLPFMRGLYSINEADLSRVEKSFEILNAFLNDKEFAAGDNLTIADFTISTTICTILVSLSFAKDIFIIIYRVYPGGYTKENKKSK